MLQYILEDYKMYTVKNILDLKRQLRNPIFHDSIFKTAKFFPQNKELYLSLLNEYENSHILLKFYNVISLHFIGLDRLCKDQTINIVCLEENNELLINNFKLFGYDDNININNYIYIVCQTFSGNELYIACEKIDIEFSLRGQNPDLRRCDGCMV